MARAGRHLTEMEPPIPLADAQARLLALAVPLAVEEIALADALGRYLAEPLIAGRTQPAAALSAMDGYALAGPDLAGPWRVIGESAAGHPFGGIVGKGECVRISTGALMPAGADTVLLQEDAARVGDRLTLTGESLRTGQHVRQAGFDFREGLTLLKAGTRVTPAVVALAFACGHARVRVRSKPRLAIIDSGDELAIDPANCAAHQIPASNGLMLTAMAAGVPCSVDRIGPVADHLDALAAALARAEGADLVVTSGGASVGDHDLMRPALERWGAEIAFWRVALKPGKPILVARRGHQLILGLPGNPVSSYVTAFLFMLPLMRALAGAAQALPTELIAPLATGLPPVGKRLELLRGRWNGASIAPINEQDSSALLALSNANGLIIRSVGAPAIEAGTPVPFYCLENGGIA